MIKEERGPISLNEMGEQIQLIAVRQNGNAIRHIDRPVLEVQLAAIKEDEQSIEFIDDPSEKVQLVVVRMDGNTIRYIDNPSEQVQLEALREDGRSIQYINNPTDYIKSITDVIETSNRTVYVLHEEGKEPLFSIGCQYNVSKDYIIWRIYNLDGGLEGNPHRHEYLDILNRY